MQNELHIALVQSDLAWKDKKTNLSALDNLIAPLKDGIDVIVLPELFNTAFCVDDMTLAENENGETVLWMKELSRKKNCAVCGSILFKDAGSFYNRFLFIEPDGKIQGYNKHHLFSLVGENNLLTPGKEKIVIVYKGWKVQPLVCYDLRYPAWCQNDDNADVQVYIASWPTKRIHHWNVLLRARAIENQCYTIGVNRTGKDFYDHEHNGHSGVYDFKGDQLCDMKSKAGIEIVKLSKEELEKYKERYPFWKDRDTFVK